MYGAETRSSSRRLGSGVFSNPPSRWRRPLFAAAFRAAVWLPWDTGKLHAARICSQNRRADSRQQRLSQVSVRPARNTQQADPWTPGNATSLRHDHSRARAAGTPPRTTVARNAKSETLINTRWTISLSPLLSGLTPLDEPLKIGPLAPLRPSESSRNLLGDYQVHRPPTRTG